MCWSRFLIALVQYCRGLIVSPGSYRGAGNCFEKTPESRMGIASPSRFAVDLGSRDDHKNIPRSIWGLLACASFKRD